MLKVYLLFVGVFAIFSTSFSQIETTSEREKFNPVALLHYSYDELVDLKSNNFSEFQKIDYYYSKSYLIEYTAGSDCASFDTENFDVSVYEKRRSWDKRVTIDLSEKYCLRIVLLASNELEHRLTIHDYQIMYHQND